MLREDVSGAVYSAIYSPINSAIRSAFSSFYIGGGSGPAPSSWTVLGPTGTSYTVPYTAILDGAGTSYSCPQAVLDGAGTSYTPV